MQNLLDCSIVSVRTNLGREFTNNAQFADFCEKHGISHNFLAPHASQTNEIVEKINHSLQEMCHAVTSVNFEVLIKLVTYKINTIQKEVVKIESFKSSTQHSSVNDFVIINIPKEDVKTKQIILDPDDQPMWESAKTVALTPNYAIVQIDVDDNFVINSIHLKMIRENKFDGYLRVDPHDHIREFIAISDMFKYGKTQSEAVKLLIFPFSLCDEAKIWFNELNE
ncbi:reverse transcriptase domain-containing protein [Tanacetum coccineum]